MKNGIIQIIVLVTLCASSFYLAYRLGGSICREDIADQTNKIQQMVQESDRNITEKVLGSSHLANLTFLCETYKRAD
jgi:hypothetical protein